MFGEGLYLEGLMFGNLRPPVSYLRDPQQIIFVFYCQDSAFFSIFDKLRLMSNRSTIPFSSVSISALLGAVQNHVTLLSMIFLLPCLCKKHSITYLAFNFFVQVFF